MGWFISLGLVAVALVALARVRTSFLAWTTAVAGVLVASSYGGLLTPVPAAVLWTVFLLIAVPLNIPPLRRKLISGPMLARIRKVLPPMSETEKQAIDAGTVWWEAELFRGDPQWKKLSDTPAPSLTEEERAFIDGPVEELCRMLDDWKITHELNDLPPEVWAFLKKHPPAQPSWSTISRPGAGSFSSYQSRRLEVNTA